MLSPEVGWGFGPCKVLAQMSALQQLTRLQLLVTRSQLQQMPQLPRLHLLQVRASQDVEGGHHQMQLQLGHLTSVQKMELSDAVLLAAKDQLPPNLCGFVWSYKCRCSAHILGAQGCFNHCLQPLLALSKLEKLHLQVPGEPYAAQEVAQLSSMSSLQELGIMFSCKPGSGLDSSAIAAWGQLPLKSLTLDFVEFSTGFVQQLTMFQHLTRLSLNRRSVFDDRLFEPSTFSSDAKPASLAAVLTQLTRLQLLAINMSTQQHYDDDDDDMAYDAHAAQLASSRVPFLAESWGFESTTALLRAIGQLQQLGSVQLWQHVSLDSAAVQQLNRMRRQLMPSWLVDCCHVYSHFLSVDD